MNLVSQLTELLANLSIKMVLMAVGAMLLALAVLRLTASRRDRNAHWWMENIQVVLSVVVVVFLFIRPHLFQAFYIPSQSMEPTLMGPPPGETSGDRLLVNKLVYRLFNPTRGDIAVFKAPPAANAEEKEFIKRVIAIPGDTIEVIGPRVLVDDQVALSMTTSDGSSGIDVSSEDLAQLAVRDNRLNIHTSSDSTLKVLVDPDPQEELTLTQVRVNGKVEMEDPEGKIRLVSSLLDYGGDGKVQGNVYLVDEAPRLIVIHGNQLQFEGGHVRVNGKKQIENYIMEAPDYNMAAKKMGPDEYFMMGDNRNNSNDSHMWGSLKRNRVIGRAEILFWPLNRVRILQIWLLAFFGLVLLGYNLLQRSFAPRH